VQPSGAQCTGGGVSHETPASVRPVAAAAGNAASATHTAATEVVLRRERIGPRSSGEACRRRAPKVVNYTASPDWCTRPETAATVATSSEGSTGLATCTMN